MYYLEDKGDLVTSEGVVTDDQTIQHGPLPRQTEEDKLMHVPPDRYYWVMLQVELSPEGCQAVSSEPIRTRAAVPPDPPLISLEVEGLDERKRLEERICELTNKRDRLSFVFKHKICMSWEDLTNIFFSYFLLGSRGLFICWRTALL